jgi:hypothetical protein
VFLISSNNENVIPQRYVDAKGIIRYKATMDVYIYFCCSIIQNTLSSLPLNSVSRAESDLI